MTRQRRRRVWAAWRTPGAVALLAIVVACGDGPTPLAPTPIAVSQGSNPTLPGGGTVVGYVQDIKPLLDADCIRCHNARTRTGRVDVSSYSATSQTLRPGDANSPLIQVTGQGGSMFREWRGSGVEKADLVRRWIVEFQARENR